jgi:hypothetical protein
MWKSETFNQPTTNKTNQNNRTDKTAFRFALVPLAFSLSPCTMALRR